MQFGAFWKVLRAMFHRPLELTPPGPLHPTRNKGGSCLTPPHAHFTSCFFCVTTSSPPTRLGCTGAHRAVRLGISRGRRIGLAGCSQPGHQKGKANAPQHLDLLRTGSISHTGSFQMTSRPGRGKMRSETGWLCFALLCFVLFCFVCMWFLVLELSVPIQ